MKTVAVIPVKMNNERVPGKNTKLLYDGTPLIHCIMNTLKLSKEVDEIYVYCSDVRIKEYLIDGVEYLERPSIYDGADADINAMHYSITQKIEADIYVLAHATAPFLRAESIDRGIQAVKSDRYDSALSVSKLQDFIWKDGNTFNFSLDKIPRTQDLEPLWVETTGLYVFSKKAMDLYHSRTGRNPYMLEVSKIEAIDIDNPIDFEIADAIYKSL
jgi:CMP-N-acetylneuraminic acid synthetase